MKKRLMKTPATLRKTAYKVFVGVCILVIAIALVLGYGWLPTKNSTFKGTPVLSTQKLIYLPDEKPQFSLNFKTPQARAWLGGRQVLAASPIQTKVLYNGQPLPFNIPVEVNQTDNGANLTLNPDGPIKPGKYTLQATVQTDKGPATTSQNFAWGVLAVNTDKSIYLPGETALIQMGVLSSNGHTICDAPLSLTVTDPNGNQAQPSVQPSGQCHGDNYVNTPDYTATYQASITGRYKMTLRLADSSYILSDYFEVAPSVPFDISRSGPTRLYPPESYPMDFKIHANQDFTGTVAETLPQSFSVTSAGGGEVTNDNDKQQISWQVNWQSGHDYNLSYEFKAPLISPAFYFVGPLKLAAASGQQVFQEARQWQIAGDAITRVGSVGTNTSSSSGTTIAVTVGAGGVAAGDFLIVKVFWSGSTGVTLTGVADTKGNTYQIDVQKGNGGSVGTYSAIVSSKIGTALVNTNTITATISATVTFRMITAAEYSGLDTTTWLDQTASGTGTSTTPTSAATATTTVADELVAGAISYNDGTANSATPGAGCTSGCPGYTEYNELHATSKGLEDEDMIVTATGTYVADATLSASKAWTASVATYKMAAAAGCTPTTDDLMRGGTYFCSGTKQAAFWAS